MACRLPGADGLDAFWELVVHGRTAWGRLPDSRLPRDLYFDAEKGKVGKSYSELGALVSDRPADPSVCPLRPEMIDRYDVAHHVFLEVASQACRDAGLDPFAMPRGRRTGVYVGHTGGSTRIGDHVYSTGIGETASWLGDVDAARQVLGADAEGVAAEVAAAVRRDHPGRRPGQRLDLEALGAAKIVREALGLEGPYLVVDAACASSLQALAIAARALREGGIEQAIVGGASYCKSDSLVLFSAAQSVSNSGSCPFGKGADGLVTAEGYVALVIKTLSRAIADGDRIRAVIRGIGVASDGKGKSLWAPRQEGQKLAVERAYPDRSEIGRLDYIEAHATSTQVGDATELGALSALLSANLPAGRKIPIGSVKANIGHTLETAGMASLVKVVLALEHGLIPPGSTCSEYNDDFDWAAGPFTVPSRAVPWPKRADGEARRAAVNAFGIGGLNVHLAIAEHLAAPVPAPAAARPRPEDHDAVAIVGIGGVLPGAHDVASFLSRLDAGTPSTVSVPPERWDLSRALDPSAPRTWHTTAGLGGFVRGFAYDWRRHKVPPKQIAAANPLQFMLLEAADAAIAQVGGVAALDRIRTGVVVGTMFGGEFSNDLQMGLRLPETSRHLRAALRRRGVAERDVERVVEAYGKKLLEKMPALVDETGSFTSSTLASRLTKSFDLMGGALALDAGDCSAVSAIAASVDLLRQGDCDAVLCAAGQRYLDLMAFEGLSLEGLLSDAPGTPFGAGRSGRVPAEGAVVLVLERLRDARAKGRRIHGVIRGVAVSSGASVPAAAGVAAAESRRQAGLAATAVKAVEISGSGVPEVDAHQVRAVAGEYGPTPVAGSLEGTIGHLGAAAAAAGIVKMTAVLGRGVMPPTPDASTVAGGPEARPGSAAVPAVDADGYRAGVVTAIHGTLVGHVVMDNGLPVPASVRESARSVPAAAAAPAPARGKVAALFPGQGSQYTDMFRGLVADSDVARECLERLDAEARGAGHGTLADTAWSADNHLGTRVWDTQWGMYLGDLLAWRVLERIGFAPDVVASHSFGEFPSLVASGAWSFADGAAATAARAATVEESGPKDGAMLSVIAPRDEVLAAIAPFAGQVWVCAENAPEQSVVGGRARAVDAVELILEGRRVRSKRLAVPSPFHTPLLSASAERLAEAIARLPIGPPARRVYSSTTAAPMASAADVRDSLVRQMTQTVRWVEVVEKLWSEGVRTFVEVGPSGVLTGLTRRILEGRAGATFLQFDQRGRDAAAHLERMRDQLAALGALAAPAPAGDAAAAARGPVVHHAVLAFDATARRRARNRAGGAAPKPGALPSAPRAAVAPAGERPAAPPASTANGHHAAPSVPVVHAVTVESVSHHAPAPPARVNRVAAVEADVVNAGSGAALEAFLVDFVMEQTGYPREIVELDADLEGDLGIDSIRKAQLFGEIGQKYGLSADASVSLDEFRTLRHLLDYMLPRVGGRTASPSNGVAARPVAVRAEAAPSVERNGHAPKPAAVSASVSEPAPAGAVGGAADVETFLVDFVVEQTGYPREIVELDADLEGDLGIDSIRKAQLFGEIGQKYGLSADASVSLDEFRTLRHLLDYMLPRVGGRAASPSNGAAARPVAVRAEAAPSVERNGHAPKPVAVSEPAPAGAVGGAGDVETFLVDFVVEQTGYPREIVELDADLEGDLGIDSIRKAQLFGEIGQKYGLSADASVSLDEFRTLRHLLDYMLPRVGGRAAEPAVQETPAVRPAAVAATPEASARIRRWTREFVATRHAHPGDALPVTLPRDLSAALEGAAASAGIDAAVLRAALVDPAAALGGIDVAIDAGSGATRGMVVGCGRSAAPSCEPFEAGAVRGFRVGVEGLPGAVLGWNDAGLIVVASGTTSAASPSGTPVGLVVERVLGGDTSATAVNLAAAAAPFRGAVHVVDPGRGTVVTVDGAGTTRERGPQLRDHAPAAALVRVAGDSSGRLALERVLADPGGTGVRDGLSATGTWLAAGTHGATVAFAGSPHGAWLPAEALALLAEAWRHAATPHEEPDGAAGAAPVTERYRLAISPLVDAVATRSLAGERVLVLAGADAAGRGLADELVAALRARGAEPTVVEATGGDHAGAALDGAIGGAPIRHLVIAAPWSASAAWVAGREASVATGYFACQRWLAARVAAADLSRSTLTAVTGLGGDLGLSGVIGSPVGGAFTGLFKNLAREYDGLQVRAVDFAADARSADVARLVAAEIESAGPVEVGYRDGRRSVVVPVAAAPVPAGRPAALARGTVWIVTGGARGVTAACGLALGRKHAVSLVLVGSTRPIAVDPAWLALDAAGAKALKGSVMVEAKARGEDPRQAWRVVEKSIEIAAAMGKFRSAGIDARYEACDLADPVAVRALAARVERECGPVRGVVHGAGWESACRFEKKTPAGLEATLGPKCVGLEHLLDALDPASLETLVAFGSTSGRLGGMGQADYSAANDLLAKIVGRARRTRPGLRAALFHWHAWDEVGMASRPESRFVLEQFGMKFMPLAEGVARFLAEIEAGLPDAEVLVTEPVFCLDARPVPAAPSAPRARGSLVERVEGSGAGSEVSFVVSPVSDTFLVDHRRSGRPLLPAVIDAELLAQAALTAGVADGVGEIRDFRVERGLVFQTDDPRRLVVAMQPAADGSLAASLREAEASPGSRPLASATVLPAPCEPVNATLDEMPFPWNPVVYRDDGPMWHGPSFRTLSGLLLDRNGGWGKLTAPDPDRVAGPRGAGGWTVPAALLDGALFACGVYSYILCGKRVEIPVRFGRLRFASDPVVGEACVVRLLFVSQDARETVYDLAIFGADGRVILALEGLAMSSLSAERSRAT